MHGLNYRLKISIIMWSLEGDEKRVAFQGFLFESRKSYDDCYIYVCTLIVFILSCCNFFSKCLPKIKQKPKNNC